LAPATETILISISTVIIVINTRRIGYDIVINPNFFY